jgi:hypothetical protein
MKMIKYIIKHSCVIKSDTMNMLIQMCFAHALHMIKSNLKNINKLYKSQIIHISLC